MKIYRNILFSAFFLLLPTAKGENNGISSDTGKDPYTVKALFIYNFTKYIEWPQLQQSLHFNIAILGETPVYERLSVLLGGRLVKEKKTEITKLLSIDQIQRPQILFIASDHSSEIGEIVKSFGASGILIITEEKNAIKWGSHMNIIEQDHKYRFELNEPALKKSGLKISKQLFDLSIVVH